MNDLVKQAGKSKLIKKLNKKLKKLKGLQSRAGDKLYGNKELMNIRMNNRVQGGLYGGTALGALLGGGTGLYGGAVMAKGKPKNWAEGLFNALAPALGGTAGAAVGAVSGGTMGVKRALKANAREKNKRAIRKLLTNTALGGGGIATIAAGAKLSKKRSKK